MVSGMMILTLLLIRMSVFVFNIQPINACPRTSEARYPSVDNTLFTNNEAHPLMEGTEDQVKISEHRITTLELEKLKQKIGVWEENRNYNEIINDYGTGLRSPTEEDLIEIASDIHVVDEISLTQKIQSTSSVDHTAKPWFPPIGNQNGEGSCVAWAVGYYMKTFQEARENGWDLSGAVWEGGYLGYPSSEYQDRIFSPDFIYHLINGGIDNGSSFCSAINLVTFVGACTWEKMPYNPNNHISWPSEEAWREAPHYRGNNTGIEYLYLETDLDINDLKSWIVSDHLAVIAVNASQYSNLTSRDVWTLDNYLPNGKNHANTVVGYNDTIEYVEEGETRYGAFKIANSWGEGGWENTADGCYWISYKAMKQRVGYCMFFRDIIDYTPRLVSSFFINHSKRAECDILIGLGDTPIVTKSFSDLVDGGNHSFCSNSILLDITEFKKSVPTVYNQSFFIKICDGGSIITGTLTDFSINYAVSDEPPLSTINGDCVFARVVLPNTIKVPSHFATIQEAIEAIDLELDPNTRMNVQIAPGTYYENVVIDKILTLVGENRKTAIIDGRYGEVAVNVTIGDVKITNLTVANSINGIWAFDCDNLKITNNILLNNSDNGISLFGGNNALVSGNVAKNNSFGITVQSAYTVCLNNSAYNGIYGLQISGENVTVCGNKISNNTEYGMVFYTSQHSSIYCNNITDNLYGFGIWDSVRDNLFYHNNFICNTLHVHFPIWIPEIYENVWNNGYPSGGNYWSNHNQTDSHSGPYQNGIGSDGIGDTPHVIDEYNADNYPLMNPWTPVNDLSINVSKGGQTHPVQVISNTTVLDLKETPGSIKLSVSGESGTSGYVRIVQPLGLNSSNIKVFVNHTRLTFPSYDPPASISTNDTRYFIYFAFNFQSNLTISIQFPIIGDITGEETGIPDGMVDMEDVGFAARRFGISKSDPSWSDHADITGPEYLVPDGEVDMRDIGLIARNFGETYQ